MQTVNYTHPQYTSPKTQTPCPKSPFCYVFNYEQIIVFIGKTVNI
jgi:hypothetical protein